MAFKNRREAATLLADRLTSYRGGRPLVLGVSRGGVPMAQEIARMLHGNLDVILVRPLSAPGHPEIALGAVTENGYFVLVDRPWVREIPREYIEAKAMATLQVLRRRRQFYTPFRSPIDPAGRVVIVVDDAIALGATVDAALKALRGMGAAKVVVAAAVAPAETVELLRERADEIVCLNIPEEFAGVSRFFEEFSEVSEEEVLGMLRRAGSRRAG